MAEITHTKISGISDGADTTVVRPSDWNDGHVIPKIASDNLRNSHDAEVTGSASTYTLVKTITLNQKLYGTVRIKFDLHMGALGDTVSGRIYHNDVAQGTERTTNSQTYVTYSEDISHDYEVNDTIQIYAKRDPLYTATYYVQNFRIYYDNADIIAISATNS